jgi:hypothetical protein
MLLIECILVLVSVLLALFCPAVASRFFESTERTFSRLAARPPLAVLAVGLFALGLRAALLPIIPIPEPIVHDEFGYLLAADTFAHGRLTNPTPPMWEHFETFSILMRPTYQCYAQPVQGLILAAGQVIAGNPFWGVWFSVGLMCAAICWMLQGWLPPGWALLGGFLAALRFGTFCYWADSYWGGAMGAVGGALVLGALPRIKREPHTRDALVMGLGLAILANNRPYEGFVFSLPIALALLFWVVGKSRPPLGVFLRRVAVPLALLLAAAGAAMGYYVWRVTGNPLTMPYQLELNQYAVAPYMLWQHLRPEPLYHFKALHDMYAVEEVRGYTLFHSWPGLVVKAFWVWKFYLGPALAFPLLMLIFVLPPGLSWKEISPQTRFLLLVCGTVLLGLAVETFYAPHYISPITGAILALVLLALKQLHSWQWRGRPSGLFLARAVPAICVATFMLRTFAAPLRIPLANNFQTAWFESGAKTFGRAEILATLDQLPGRQLVIVHYQPDHEPFAEWVYNHADIEASKVVWARDMGPQNEELIQYFKDRTVWLLEADEKPPRLLPYMGN